MRPVLFLYNCFIRLYYLVLWLAAWRNKKAAAWIAGRKAVFPQLQQALSPGDAVIWMHCSSAGEFEQGKPVLEALKKAYPQKKILVTFFSPSGYTAAKQYPYADVLTYLPLDTRKNAARFFASTRPELAIFVKYEFWYHHLSVAASHQVPLLLISAVFRPDQLFFKRYGAFYRQMLFFFRHIFVQDRASILLLQQHGIPHSSISGDTRFDRVAEIANNAPALPLIEKFAAEKPVLVAGSTWPGDEERLAAYIQQNKNIRLILAPHEVQAAHIAQVQALFEDAVLYSSLSETAEAPFPASARVLIIDTVGLLSRLYRFATLTYVGGGFTRDGIHNILEAAVWSKPVLFGPQYKKYREAVELLSAGGAFTFATAAELQQIADDLLSQADRRQQAGLRAGEYVVQNTGATANILQLIQEKRLLTRL